MLPRTNETEDQPNNNTFKEARQKIKQLFENNTLKNAITEFYEVQRNFHQNITKLVNALSIIMPLLPEDRQYVLSSLLIPYRVLTKNPFRAPTNDIERDILHITQVISQRNVQFTKTLTALLNSTANIKAFHRILEECQNNEKIAAILKSQPDCGSWLYIQGYIDLPFQNLMRYKLLLTTIKKIFEEGDSMPADHISKSLNQSIDYLVPEVNVINDCRETILLINKIDRALTLLLSDITLQVGVINRIDLGNRDLIKEQIEIIMSTLTEGKKNIIKGEQEIGIFYEGIFELLKHLRSHFKTPIEGDEANNGWGAYVANTGYYMLSLPFTMFSQAQPTSKFTPSDALSELQVVTKELSDTLDQINALESVQEKLLQANRPCGYRP